MLSTASYRKRQENILWAAGYNVFRIPLPPGVLIPLSSAIGLLFISLRMDIIAVSEPFCHRLDLSPSGRAVPGPAT